MGIIAAILVAVLDTLVFVRQGPSIARFFYMLTPFGRLRTLYKDLAKITPGMQVGYATRVLGEPELKNMKGGYQEFVYDKKDCYVQVVTGESDAILLLSVTARNSRFHAPTWVTTARWSPRPDPKNSHLGHFRFDQIASADRPPWGVSGWCGARRFGYIESYYYGNPGNYETFLLALNDAGHVWDIDSLGQVSSLFLKPVEHGNLLWIDRRPRPINVRKPKEPPNQGEAIHEFLARPDTQTWRRMKPNTYAVTAPNVFIADLLHDGFSVGPDSDQVRLLPSFGKS